MQNREQVVVEYLRLRFLLNKPNAKSNERTDVHFIMQSTDSKGFEIFATLKGVENAKTLLICAKQKGFKWKGGGYSGLFNLEYFCFTFLNKNMPQNPNYLEREKVLSQMDSELRSLGISIK